MPLNLLVAFFIGVNFGWYISAWYIFGLFLHWFGIDPDLDLPGINRSEALWMKLIIPIPLVGWSAFYARIFQKFGGHRSIWTHGFLISTFIRLMYFSFPFLLAYRHYFGYGHSLLGEFFGMFMAMAICDAYHILADMGTGEMNYGGRIRLSFIGWWIKYKFNFPDNSKRRKR